VLVAVLVVASVAASVVAPATYGGTRRTAVADRRHRCPSPILSNAPTIEATIAAARRAFDAGSVSSQGRVHRVTRANAPIVAIVRLAGGAVTGRARVARVDVLRRLATARCGARVAAASWAVVVELRLAQAANSQLGILFVVNTPNGATAY
jgi:hypothetical protein